MASVTVTILSCASSRENGVKLVTINNIATIQSPNRRADHIAKHSLKQTGVTTLYAQQLIKMHLETIKHRDFRFVNKIFSITCGDLVKGCEIWNSPDCFSFESFHGACYDIE